MTKTTLINLANETFKDCIETLQKKNADYSGDRDDALSNFKLVEQLNVTDVRTGTVVRICDKLARISTLIKRDPTVEDERLEDTIKDAINYLVILLAESEELAQKHEDAGKGEING